MLTGQIVQAVVRIVLELLQDAGIAAALTEDAPAPVVKLCKETQSWREIDWMIVRMATCRAPGNSVTLLLQGQTMS